MLWASLWLLPLFWLGLRCLGLQRWQAWLDRAPLGTHPPLGADDAAALGLADVLAVSLECGDRLVPATLRLSRAMARGVVVVPRVPDLAGLPPILGPCGLRRR